MRKIVSILVAGVMSACASIGMVDELAVPAAIPEGPDHLPSGMGWSLVWSDEFSDHELDFSKWELEESCWGGGNDERQCYTARKRNVDVVNGLLRLKAFRETVSGPEFPQGHPDGPGGRITQKYTSGKLRTRGRYDWTYGRFSARIKLPTGQGTWLAFWMLPAQDHYGRWAASGEIDIMEAVNLGERCDECLGGEGENRTSGALHFGGAWPDNTYRVKYLRLPGGVGQTDEFHVYSVEWGAGQINWFVDDELFYTLRSDDWFTTGSAQSAAPFDQPFYLMLNLAVGGKLSETNNRKGFDPASFPAQMLVDWVRVYQCEPDKITGLACMQAPLETD